MIIPQKEMEHRIDYAERMFTFYNIEHKLRNRVTGRFDCYRKSDGKKFEYYAGTGKIMGVVGVDGVSALMAILSK